MPAPDYSDLDPAFGHWLAGFVDGEGSFCIQKPRNAFICTFTISLRRDDKPILLDAQERLGGIGLMRDTPARTSRSPNANPEVSWDVGSKLGTAAVVVVFDRFPLRAKKARDFAVWREAVAEWNRIGPGRGISGTDWSRMAEFKRLLEEGRRYDGPRTSPSDVPPIAQLELAPRR